MSGQILGDSFRPSSGDTKSSFEHMSLSLLHLLVNTPSTHVELGRLKAVCGLHHSFIYFFDIGWLCALSKAAVFDRVMAWNGEVHCSSHHKAGLERSLMPCLHGMSRNNHSLTDSKPSLDRAIRDREKGKVG